MFLFLTDRETELRVVNRVTPGQSGGSKGKFGSTGLQTYVVSLSPSDSITCSKNTHLALNCRFSRLLKPLGMSFWGEGSERSFYFNKI